MFFGNNETDELLWTLFRNILALRESYYWFDSKKGKLLFQHLGRVMKGEPLREWSKLTGNQRVFTLPAFKDKCSDLIDDLFGEVGYDDQLEYLRDKSMTTSMKLSEWIDWIAVINAVLPSPTKDGQETTEHKLVKKVVTVELTVRHQVILAIISQLQGS